MGEDHGRREELRVHHRRIPRCKGGICTESVVRNWRDHNLHSAERAGGVHSTDEVTDGFRPKRNAHQALDRIRKDTGKKGWWVVDADIR
ncbi:hypothetical protein SAMN02745176_01898 [Lutispora thermophila DSM 19022]|uniref:Uncharacterized protein n=1 Tax=Lutispora thermophila DSM 19022 TaxID=1122184 RepID=A0A1M6FA45_9FIRM|nr:hypothetical protein SAMN02745176_01898 [Lutispora thermophila DSM 19022]